MKNSATLPDPARYGRGTGVPDPVDVQVGARVRNRVSASRLSEIADILSVPISYFFSDLDPAGGEPSVQKVAARERLQRPETIELIRSYYAISDPAVRHQFLDMVKAVAQTHQREP